MMRLDQVLSFAKEYPAVAAVAAVVVLAVVAAGGRAVRVLVRGRQAEDVLTLVAASVATTVVMNGMWRFAGNVLHFSGAERDTMFAFLELAMLTEAFRARRNIRESAARAEQARQRGDQPEPVTAGVDGAAVWALSALSAVLSSLDASSAAEAVARLTAPLVAAWLWERGLSLYRRQLTGSRTIHWRLTAERVLVRVGLAEPTGRATSEVAAQRRLTQLALAAKRARMLRESGAASWRQRWAGRRLDVALARAVEHADLASDAGRQDALLAQMGALHGAAGLARLSPPAPWHDRPALTGTRTDASEDAPAARTGASVRPELQARTDASCTGLPAGGRRVVPAPGEVDRAAIVAELAEELQDAIASGDRWRPDYPALMARTGYRRSWCEKVVRDARAAALLCTDQGPDQPGPDPDEAPARTETAELAGVAS
jgi:hypothetical protein